MNYFNEDFSDMEKIAYAIHQLAEAIHCLGTGDAATTMGAVEMLAMEVRDGAKATSQALESGLNDIATAIDSIPTDGRA